MGSYLSKRRESIRKEDCCGGTVISTPSCSPPDSPSRRSESPVQASYIYCGNHLCGSTALFEDLVTWKEARVGNKHVYYFCKDECWKEWLSSPAHLGSWASPISLATTRSPSIEGTSPPDIPMISI